MSDASWEAALRRYSSKIKKLAFNVTATFNSMKRIRMKFILRKSSKRTRKVQSFSLGKNNTTKSTMPICCGMLRLIPARSNAVILHLTQDESILHHDQGSSTVSVSGADITSALSRILIRFCDEVMWQELTFSIPNATV